MLMPGRRFSSDKYRYGFNGKENDNEVKGEGNQQDYGMRVYDGRIGKFLSVDPLQADYPELTTYQFASNTPIQGVDLDGREVYHYVLITYSDDRKPKLKPLSVQTREFAAWEFIDNKQPANSGASAQGEIITTKTIRVWRQNEESGFFGWQEGDDIGYLAPHIDFSSFKELNEWKNAGYPVTPPSPSEVEAQRKAGEELAQQATLQLTLMTLSQQIDVADGDFDGYTATASQPRPSTNTATSTQSTSINGGTTPVGGKITGYTKHGLNQAIGRNGGRGVSATAILGAINNPIKIKPGKNGTISYKGKEATVVLNKARKVVTTYGKARGPQQRVADSRKEGSGSAQRKANKRGFSYNPKAIK